MMSDVTTVILWKSVSLRLGDNGSDDTWHDRRGLGKEMMRIQPDIPVILCTGYSDLISSEKALAEGFEGFIMKPFRIREGAELVRHVLDGKG